MTSTKSDTINALPTGELPVVTSVKPSPTPRGAVEAVAPDAAETLMERVRRGQAERHAAELERYCSARKIPRHRLGERAGQVHSVVLAPVGEPPQPRTGEPSLLARLLGGTR